MLHPCGKPGPQDELKMQAQPNKQELFDLLIQAKRTEAYTPFPRADVQNSRLIHNFAVHSDGDPLL
jgi:hypothetical protein